MPENYLFEATFANEGLGTKDFEYQLDPNNPNRIKGLLECWKQAIESYCETDLKARVMLDQFAEKDFWNFHDLRELSIKYKDETGSSNRLYCISTNYTSIGFEVG